MTGNYSDDQIITLDFEDGVSFDCGIMGIFDVDGQDYIALEALDGSEDVYLYGYKPILWAAENNVTGGTGEGEFSPKAFCSRAQVVTFLYKVKDLLQPVG